MSTVREFWGQSAVRCARYVEIFNRRDFASEQFRKIGKRCTLEHFRFVLYHAAEDSEMVLTARDRKRTLPLKSPRILIAPTLVDDKKS